VAALDGPPVIRFFLGFIFGAVVGAGATYVYYHYFRHHGPTRPALHGAGEAPAGGASSGGGPRRGRRSRNATAVPALDPNAPTPALADADLVPLAEGDALRPAARTVDMSAASAETRDLAQDEIDGAMSRRAPEIIKCIVDARGNAPVVGRVTVGLVVGADGGVTKTRVEAPAWLMHHGLAGCVRPKLKEVRFPAAGKDTVVTVPFDLHE
jgi:hypothetical protein